MFGNSSIKSTGESDYPKSFIVSQSRILANISFTAEEKYQNFLEKYPHIVNRIPQHMIASYIGITPETLTRLRRNMVKK